MSGVRVIDFAKIEQDIEYRTLNKYGGQHVGVDSSVLALHKPTGLAVLRDSERSMLKNKQKATVDLVDYLSRLHLIKCTCED
jgi:protein subunit release factor A